MRTRTPEAVGEFFPSMPQMKTSKGDYGHIELSPRSRAMERRGKDMSQKRTTEEGNGSEKISRVRPRWED